MYENYYLRKGYFRRCKKGNYIKRDGTYEPVHPGEGDYIWVNSKYLPKRSKTRKEGD